MARKDQNGGERQDAEIRERLHGHCARINAQQMLPEMPLMTRIVGNVALARCKIADRDERRNADGGRAEHRPQPDVGHIPHGAGDVHADLRTCGGDPDQRAPRRGRQSPLLAQPAKGLGEMIRAPFCGEDGSHQHGCPDPCAHASPRQTARTLRMGDVRSARFSLLGLSLMQAHEPKPTRFRADRSGRHG